MQLFRQNHGDQGQEWVEQRRLKSCCLSQSHWSYLLLHFRVQLPLRSTHKYPSSEVRSNNRLHRARERAHGPLVKNLRKLGQPCVHKRDLRGLWSRRRCRTSRSYRGQPRIEDASFLLSHCDKCSDRHPEKYRKIRDRERERSRCEPLRPNEHQGSQSIRQHARTSHQT